MKKQFSNHTQYQPSTHTDDMGTSGCIGYDMKIAI